MKQIFQAVDGQTVKYCMIGYIGGAAGVTVALAAAAAVPGVF